MLVQQQQVTATISGQVLGFSNDLVDTSELTVHYSPRGTMTSLVCTLVGKKVGAADAILDTYEGVVATSRTVSLADVTYDSFQLEPVWEGERASLDVRLDLSH